MIVIQWLAKLVVISWVLSCASGCCGGRSVVVQTGGAGEPMRGVIVSGYGEAKGAPDIARTTVGVEVRAETVEGGSTQASARMNAVIASLRSAGVAEADLRTQNFSISYEQEPVPPTPPPQEAETTRGPTKHKVAGSAEVGAPAASPAIRGYYRISNMMEVTVRDLSKLGQLLKLVTEAGANNVWGTSFEIEHPEVLVAQAREKAVEHAKKNAGELARLTGIKLGPIVSVSEDGGSQPMPMMKAMRAEASQDVPIERGEISATQNVRLVYALPGHHP